MKPKTPVVIDTGTSNKKVYFGDGGEVVDKPIVKKKVDKTPKADVAAVEEETSGEITQKPKKGFKKYPQNGEDLETKWYQVYEEYNTNEFKDIKDSELSTLQQLCRSCFNDEIQKLSKSKLKLMNFSFLCLSIFPACRQSIRLKVAADSSSKRNIEGSGECWSFVGSNESIAQHRCTGILNHAHEIIQQNQHRCV